jgi:beta-phosphoglucomutase-like phosphatase (HAD superfamily)
MFDMAGTTVRDNNEVLHCFAKACRKEGIMASEKRLNALMGVSKLEVFQLLWREQLGEKIADDTIAEKSKHSFHAFRHILEDYYHAQPVQPTTGALETFDWLQSHDIKIALNTGFYRGVTDIILNKLGWMAGLDANYIGGIGSIINFSITSDEVPQGRPTPYMIQKAMSVFGISDPNTGRFAGRSQRGLCAFTGRDQRDAQPPRARSIGQRWLVGIAASIASCNHILALHHKKCPRFLSSHSRQLETRHFI